jgi:hypothetical protein
MIQGLLRVDAGGRVGDPPLRILGAASLLIFTSAAVASAQGRTDIATLCKDRKPCTLVKPTPAGKDAQGRALTVIELNLGPKNPDNDGGNERFNCRPYGREFWVRTAGVAEPRRVLSLCNDGYGASGVGEDEVKIGPKGQRGFVTFGKPRPRGAELRVLMTSGRDLVVSVSDTAFATGAAPISRASPATTRRSSSRNGRSASTARCITAPATSRARPKSSSAPRGAPAGANR